MKWFWIILLIVVGVVAAVLAYEYLSFGNAHLASWVPGHIAVVPGHKAPRGNHHHRGIVAAFVALVAFAGAGWLIYKNYRDTKIEQPAATAT